MNTESEAASATPRRCAKCGACTAVCPVYQVSGRESLTARGRLHLLGKLTHPLSSRVCREIFSKCLLCGACVQACPRGINIIDFFLAAREEAGEINITTAIKKALTYKVLDSGLLMRITGRGFRFLDHTLPAESGLRPRLGLSAASAPAGEHSNFINSQPPAALKPQLLYFTGCLANHLQPVIARASRELVRIITGQELYAPPGQTCCGMAAFNAADHQQALNLCKANITIFEQPPYNEQKIFTSCASCFAHLKSYPRLLAHDRQWAVRAAAFARRVEEFSSFLRAGITSAPQRKGKAKIKKIVYHDPCHLRFMAAEDQRDFNGAARQLIALAPGLELVELPHGSQCCGQGGLFRLSHPRLSRRIGRNLWQDFAAADAPLATTTCTGCLFQWRQGLSETAVKAKVLHLAEILLEAEDINQGRRDK